MELKRGLPVGGQALPNGVMMQSGNKVSLAMRLRSGAIVTETWAGKHKQPANNKPPILRGIYQLASSFRASAQTLRLAFRLLKQANQPRVTLNLTLQLAAVVIVLVFYAIASDRWYGILRSLIPDSSPYFLFTIAYALSDLLLFLLSLFFISLLPSVNKLLKYHGAEHKAINCYEKGIDLTIENVKAQNRFHKRCGTSMVAVIFVAVFTVFVFLPPQLTETEQGLILCAVMLVAAGVSYEAMRSKRMPFVLRLWLAAQRFTTKEPSDEMIECAITALTAAVKQ